ncbi:MAG: orotidine-5'-phosphate decarboxylase [Phycisphaerae bacterium]|nr:orotidine-5'-phosphate decarboxylase [Phycisphaerae bacterium]
MSSNFADRLLEGIKAKGSPIAVGLDPQYSRLPLVIRENKELNDELDTESAVDAIFDFSTKIMRIIAPHVAAVKLNIAFFEKYYWEGIEAYYSLVEEANDLGLEIIGDVKRADIPDTNEVYSRSHLANPEFTNMEDLLAPDAVTVNPYFGIEALRPFFNIAAEQGKGIFVVCRSSNPEAHEIQDFVNADGKKLYEHVAELISKVGAEPAMMGNHGYSCLGAVVGATDPDAAKQLREIMPHTLFLVPGYGTQGGTADAARACFKDDGTGAIVTATRSIIYAYESDQYKGSPSWEKAVEQAVIDMKEQIKAVLGG